MTDTQNPSTQQPSNRTPIRQLREENVQIKVPLVEGEAYVRSPAAPEAVVTDFEVIYQGGETRRHTRIDPFTLVDALQHYGYTIEALPIARTEDELTDRRSRSERQQIPNSNSSDSYEEVSINE